MTIPQTCVKSHSAFLPHPWSHQPSLDLPLDSGECYGKFDDVTYEMDEKVTVHKTWVKSHPAPPLTPYGHSNAMSTFPWTLGIIMETLVTLAISETKCIKNRQTKILVYIDRCSLPYPASTLIAKR